MKAALILLSLFFLMVTFRSHATVETEDFTPIEKQITQLLNAKDHLVSQIDTRSLPIREYLSYGIYRESCHKLFLEFNRIKSDSTSYPDSSSQLYRHLKSCSQGVDGLAFLYSQQKTH
jgi:hypothetical protein